MSKRTLTITIVILITILLAFIVWFWAFELESLRDEAYSLPEWNLINEYETIEQLSINESTAWSNDNADDFIDKGIETQDTSTEIKLTRKTYRLITGNGCAILVVTSLMGRNNVEVEQDLLYIDDCDLMR